MWHAKCRPFIEKHGLLLLQELFAAALLFRFAYVFNTSPLLHIWSDPGRHWENAHHFLHPYFWGSADPLMYQAYLASVLFITRENAFGINLCTGLLSASMAWFWYKALLELLPRKWALGGAVAVALWPSTLMIYSYFMNETLLLATMAAAVWLTLRADRLRTLPAFAWAVALWALASYTRVTALPLCLVSVGYLLLQDRRKWLLKLCMLAAANGVLAVPACWHSEIHLKFYAPYVFTYMNEIYRASEKRTVTINVKGEGRWGFGSPTYYHPALAPLSNWMTPRTGEVHVDIDPAHGRADWEAALLRVESEPKPFSALQDWAENTMYLFFDPSWPDNNTAYRMGWLAVQSRWLVLPLTVLVAGLALRLRRHVPWKTLLLPGLALLLIGLLMVQTSFIIEGRYRIAAEPLLVAAFAVLLHAWKRRRQTAASM